MMIKKILFGLSALALFAACTDDYTDWAQPQSNAEVPAKSVDWTVTAAQQAIILDDVTDESIKLINVTLPEGITAESFNVKLTGEDTKYTDYGITADANGMVSVEDLQKATTEMYTLEAVERTFKAVVSTSIALTGATGNASVYMETEPFEIKVTPKAPTFSPYIYEAGVNNSWGAVEQPLFCANQDGVYVGFFYAQDADWSGGKGAFKFTGAFNNWDHGNYGTGTMSEDGLIGTLIDDGNSGNILVEPGFYRAKVNMVAMTYELTPIQIGIIGPAQAGGWSDDTDLTYNPETFAWEVTIDLVPDEFKFRANDDWAINWGGSADNLTQDGSNLKINEAGTYFIQFFPLCETKSYCTITKK
jgi:hypothetical protein